MPPHSQQKHKVQYQMASDAVTKEIKLAWNLSASTAEQYGLSLGSGLRIYVDDQAGRLVLERRYPEFSLEGTRSIPLPAESILTLQIFIDCSSVEIFVNEGYACLSSRIYPQPGCAYYHCLHITAQPCYRRPDTGVCENHLKYETIIFLVINSLSVHHNDFKARAITKK